MLWRSNKDEWTSGSRHEFYCGRGIEREILIEVRAFYNSNLHVRLNQKFALALNVEYGRLMGWLHTGQEAAEEMNEPDAPKFYKANVQLGAVNFLPPHTAD